jgi:hypothetical protein
MKPFIALFIIALISLAAIAQPPDTLWTSTFGGNSGDGGSSVQQTADGGYVIAGYTGSFGAGHTDVYLIKTDASGNQVWTSTFGGSSYDWGYSVQQTSDSGYIIAGSCFAHGNVYLIKTNPAGDALWTRTFFGGNNWDEGFSVQQTSDAGFIIAGYTTLFGSGSEDVYLIKTDAAGNQTWTRTFGGSNSDYGYSVQQTTDGGYVIAGSTLSFGAGDYDVYLIKTDAAGNPTWTRTFGGGYGDAGSSVQQTADGGYVIAGETQSFGAGDSDVYLIKTDAAGNPTWTRTFGGGYWDAGSSVQQTADGGYVIAGSTFSFGPGSMDVYLIKTDASGNQTWTRTFGGSSDDFGSSVQQTADGGYVIAGSTFSFGAGSMDVYLIKTDAGGTPVTPETELNALPECFKLYPPHPNPFNAFTALSYELRAASHVSLKIYDTSGRLITTLVNDKQPAGIHTAAFDGAGLSSGIYLAKLQAGEFTATQKLVLLK